jgi:hypothetical protein
MANPVAFFKKHTAASILFAFSLVLGFIVYGDFGIAWDEPLQRDIGLHSYNYVFKGDTTLNDFKNRDYGVAIELPLIFLEKALGLSDSRDIYRMRHITVHLFFLLSALAFYLLIWILYRNKWLALAGYLMLLLSPRIYAQSFFNSKDIPFLCMFIFSFLAFAVSFRDKKFWQFVLFGIISGLLINIRIMGIIIPVLVTVFVLADMTKSGERRAMLNRYGIYIVLTVAVAILTWPWLWDDPVGRFRIAFANMSKFRWDNNILVNGEYVRASVVGWTYLPRWFGLTTPVVYLLFGITGMIALVLHFLRKPLDYIRPGLNRNQIIYLACFAGPVISVIVLHSVLYDGWRQMYFIYPAFLLLAVYGIHSLVNSRLLNSDFMMTLVTTFLLLISFSATGLFMIRSHPFEDVYFNRLLPRYDQYHRKTFEMDYWGTSYKQAMEYIADHDTAPVLNIRVANLAGEHNLFILKPTDRKRIRLVETDREADYFIANYRWHRWDYPFPKEKKIFSITVQNSEICSAWKLH